MGIIQVGIVRVGVMLGGNFLWWGFSEWELSGGNHPGGNFLSGTFHVTKIPILVEKEFTAGCFVRGHHIYQCEWDAKIVRKG